jgi:RNA polymerase sigma-70 factor (ECF subfamily)
MAEESANLVARWRAGDQRAADEMFRRYAEQLMVFARARLSPKFDPRGDPEAVVQSAYRSLFDGVRAGRFEVHRGGDLWQLLVVITLHKLQHQVRHNLADKRTVDREQTFGDEKDLFTLQPNMCAHEPLPVEAVALGDELEQLLRQLEPNHRRMVELRLQGYNLEEIATQTRRCPGTVRRVLDGIKEHLRQWLSADASS